MSARRAGAALALVLALAAGAAAAHGIGMSDLQLRLEGARLDGTITLHLADARRMAGLDPARTGEPGWRDLQAHAGPLRAFLAGAWTVRAGAAPCTVALVDSPLTWEASLQQVRARIVVRCPQAPDTLRLRADAFFTRDPAHRAYFAVQDSRATSVGVLRADQREAVFAVRQFHPWETAGEFAVDGIGHIGTGLDHLLFLLALLLPAALVRSGSGWVPRAGFMPSMREVTKVVTAFTAAHSVTLALSFFGVLRLPAQWVETGIAASVFAAAWNNLRPFLPGRAWVVAAIFGLVHGMGFAGALGNLSLPREARVLALASFNVGVEAGQLAIVVLAMPVLFAASRRGWYPRLVMGAGSLVIAWLAVIWVLQRGFSLTLFAGH